MAKIILTLRQYQHIKDGNPWVIGKIRNVENLLLVLQDPKNSVYVTQDGIEVMKLEFDPQETRQVKEIPTYQGSFW